MTDVVTALRAYAEELRKEAEIQDRQHLVKCATVLTAAKGLLALSTLLKGGK